MNQTRAAKTIIECIRNNNIMRLSYRKSSGSKRAIVRMVEPYEIKQEGDKKYLYAYDVSGKTKTIKSFLLENILSAQKQARVFTPRTF